MLLQLAMLCNRAYSCNCTTAAKFHREVYCLLSAQSCRRIFNYAHCMSSVCTTVHSQFCSLSLSYIDDDNAHCCFGGYSYIIDCDKNTYSLRIDDIYVPKNIGNHIRHLLGISVGLHGTRACCPIGCQTLTTSSMEKNYKIREIKILSFVVNI